MKSKHWRQALGDLLILSGVLALVALGLFWTRSALAAHQLAGQYSLVVAERMTLPLPTAAGAAQSRGQGEGEPLAILQTALAAPTATPAATLPPQEEPGAPAEPPLPVEPTATPEGGEYPAPEQSPNPPPEAQPSPTPEPPPAPAPNLSTGRPVRLVIPSLGIDRAVVPLELRANAQGRLDWNTDKLFATAKRADLVGQPVTSLNPGEGGNIVFMGHNYDNGYYAWEGVFVNIKSLAPGALIIVYTEGGGEYHYTVQLVKKVRWINQTSAEAEKHLKFLGPTPSEQLTLVTCGGANVWPWPARLYVVAAPGG